MTLLSSSNTSYNTFIQDSSENLNKALLPTSLSSSNSKNNNIIYIRKEFKAKLKYIVKRLLPASQKNAWLAFEDILNSNNELSKIFTGHKKMAKRGRYSERTSKTIMKLLNELNIILKQRRGFKKSNRYFINWNLVYERPDLLEEYVSRVKCNSCTLSSSSTEEVIIINNDKDNFIEKEVLEEKKYDIETYTISKNLSLKLEKEGVKAVSQYFWRDKFRLIAKDSKPWNGEKDWDIINANFAFSGFIHRERSKQKELGSLYICPITRKQYREKQKSLSTVNAAALVKKECFEGGDLSTTHINKGLNGIDHYLEKPIDRSNNIEVDYMDKIMAEFRNKMSN